MMSCMSFRTNRFLRAEHALIPHPSTFYSRQSSMAPWKQQSYAFKVIRQGDILSPYIFILVIEFWSISMKLKNSFGSMKHITVNSKLFVSHLLFADDMLVLCTSKS